MYLKYVRQAKLDGCLRLYFVLCFGCSVIGSHGYVKKGATCLKLPE